MESTESCCGRSSSNDQAINPELARFYPRRVGTTTCAFFNNDDEEYRVLLPFIKDGFECGDKQFSVVNPDERRDHLQRLAVVRVTRPPPSKVGNSSFGPTPKPTFGTAVSIRIGS